MEQLLEKIDNFKMYYIIYIIKSDASQVEVEFEYPSGLENFCLKNFGTFTRTSARELKMDAVACSHFKC